MNCRITALGTASLLFLLSTFSVAQTQRNKWGVGFNHGGQRLYGDRPEAEMGIGVEGVVSYRILPFADVSFALGYSQLKYELIPDGPKNTTDMITADLKGNLEIISQGLFRPYIVGGIGLLNSDVRNSGRGRFWDAAFFGGGGFKLQLSPLFAWYVGADYRFTTGDSFDNLDEGSANDAYLNVRAGLSYYVPGKDAPDVISGESSPFYELEEGSNLTEDQPIATTETEQETNDIEKYVRLKSRVNELSGNLDSTEREILKLQDALSRRKKQLSLLENKTLDQSTKTVAQSSSRSAFSEIYKEALTNHYSKKYEQAILLFRLLLQEDPDHMLSSSCLYWVGRGLFAMERYEESIDVFYQVLGFERSLKKDDSLLLLGKAYLKIGSRDRAKESFIRLIQEYPGSEFVVEATDYIDKL